MNRKGKCFWCIVALFVLLTGCIPNKPLNEKEIDNLVIENKEWADAIGLLEKESAPFSGLVETDSEIQAELMCDRSVSSYEDLCSVVNAHNEFVENNPDYFGDDIDITFLCEWEGSYQPMRFFNKNCSFYGFQEYEAYLNREKTAKIEYAYINMGRVPELGEMSSKFNVPVVVLGAVDYPSWPTEEDYKILSGFANPELVVIDYYSEKMEYDPAEICETIQKYAPGVKVFDVRSSTYVN